MSVHLIEHGEELVTVADPVVVGHSRRIVQHHLHQGEGTGVPEFISIEQSSTIECAYQPPPSPQKMLPLSVACRTTCERSNSILILPQDTHTQNCKKSHNS
jgi:hypothetical protein